MYSKSSESWKCRNVVYIYNNFTFTLYIFTIISVLLNKCFLGNNSKMFLFQLTSWILLTSLSSNHLSLFWKVMLIFYILINSLRINTFFCSSWIYTFVMHSIIKQNGLYTAFYVDFKAKMITNLPFWHQPHATRRKEQNLKTVCPHYVNSVMKTSQYMESGSFSSVSVETIHSE